MNKRQMFSVPLKVGAEGYQVKLSGTRFTIKGRIFFMPHIIRCGVHCQRMVEVKYINVLKRGRMNLEKFVSGWTA